MAIPPGENERRSALSSKQWSAEELELPWFVSQRTYVLLWFITGLLSLGAVALVAAVIRHVPT